jgi:hypothetical protein
VEGTPERIERPDHDVPLGRMAQPEQIASVAALCRGFGASDGRGTTVGADSAIVIQQPGG